MGVHIVQGKWLISTREAFDFSVLCKDARIKISQARRSIIKGHPPLQVLELEETCSATSRHINLDAFYSHSSSVLMNPDEFILPELDVNVIFMWEPFVRQLPNFSATEIPAKLRDIKQVNMNEMIDNIRSLRFQPEEIPIWRDKRVIVIPQCVWSLWDLLFTLVSLRKRIKHGCNQIADRVAKKDVSGLSPNVEFELVPISDTNNVNSKVINDVAAVDGSDSQTPMQIPDNVTVRSNKYLYPTLRLHITE